jgi:hypothetical protein
MTNWKSFLAPVVVFVLGLICGGGGVALYALREIRASVATDAGDGARRATQMITRTLRLDVEQREAAQPVFDRLARELAAIRIESSPRVRAAIAHAAGELRPLLRPPQQRRLDVLMQRARARWGRQLPAQGLERPAAPPPASRAPATP